MEVLNLAVIGAAPITAEQGMRPYEVQRARHGSATVLSHGQKHVLWHCLAHYLEEVPCEVGLAPLLVCAAHTNPLSL